ncbi:hypothetical protein GYA49_02530 [Candidatus Beckwithbacteria bacterium]|nr:hypothetical protein [Candidatus Beckwithbacteria bacterium]
MNKITKLSFQRNRQHVTVFLDNGQSFSLHGELVLKRGLKVGQSLDETQILKLLQQSQLISLYYHITNLIAIRPRSEFEIKTRIKQQFNKLNNKICKQFPIFTAIDYAIASQKIIERLVENNFINDETFATWWVEQRLAQKAKGEFALAAELAAKGIDRQIIAKTLAKQSLLKPENKQQTIKDLLAKQWQKIAYKKPDKKKAKQLLIQRLLSRGFAWEDIKIQIDEFLDTQYNNAR